MPIEFANQADILEQVTMRLISQIPELQPETCFLSDLPTPAIWPPASDVFVTVSPGQGEYDQGMFAAAGEEQVCERGSFLVSIFKAMQSDPISAADIALLQGQAGLLRYWKLIVLQSLLKGAWEPTDSGGPLLRDALYPIGASAPQEVHQGDDEGGIRWSRLQMQFGITFDWNVTGALS